MHPLGCTRALGECEEIISVAAAGHPGAIPGGHDVPRPLHRATGVSVKAAVKDVKEEDVQQRCEWVSLADRRADVKRVSQAVGSNDSAPGTHQARSDVIYREGREAVPVEGRADRVKLNRVVSLLYIIAHNM